MDKYSIARLLHEMPEFRDLRFSHVITQENGKIIDWVEMKNQNDALRIDPQDFVDLCSTVSWLYQNAKEKEK